MRSTLGSLASIGFLVLGCGDDGPSGMASTTSPQSSSSMGDPTDGDTSTSGTAATSESSAADAESLDDSSSTGTSIVCGDDVVDGDEVCDGMALGEETCLTQGFDAGELACAADCSGYDTRGCLTAVCGDGVAVGAELCDGPDTLDANCRSEGFDSGTLACLEDCATYDTSGCGLCGNNQVDGTEPCDGVWLQGQNCVTQGFDSGALGCGLDCLGFDTSGCGLCGNGVVDGAELCDGPDLGANDCMGLGFTGGELACAAGCGGFDVYGCGVVQYDVSAPVVNNTQVNQFRGNGYTADANGVLVDFQMYLGLAAACDLDFYVYEAPALGGPYTQVARTTVAAGPGIDYYAAGIPLVPVTGGMYYVLGVGWLCSVTNYRSTDGTFAGMDAGIGTVTVNHFDNAYAGASDLYVPPNTGVANTVYVQRVFFGE